MKHLLLMTAFSCLCMITYSGYSQDNSAAEKAWMAYKTPGDMHKMLASDVGEWKTETTSWMDPGGAPTKSTGSCTNRMLLDGRFLETHHTASMMGMPFEGWGTIGYDNAKKMFVSSWVDNFGTGLMYMEGTWDDAQKAIVSKGKFPDPESGKDMEMKEIYKIIDNNSRVMEMYVTGPDGKDFKVMELKYTRK